jgi:hypothetical protein
MIATIGTASAIGLINDNDHTPEAVSKTIWMPDETEMNLADSYTNDQGKGGWDPDHGYELKPTISDVDGDALTVNLDVPDTFAGELWYDDETSGWSQITADTTLSQAEFESLHYKPDGVETGDGLDNIDDSLRLNFTVSDGANTSIPHYLDINTVLLEGTTSQSVTVGEKAGTPLTSGNNHEGEMIFTEESAQAINEEDVRVLTIHHDYHSMNKPLGGSGDLPDEGAGYSLSEFDIVIELNGTQFLVNYADSPGTDNRLAAWDEGGDTGDNTWSLVQDDGYYVWEETLDFDQIFLVTNPGRDKTVRAEIDETQTLSDYLDVNTIEAGDTWTLVYNDFTSGNDQARFAEGIFTFGVEEDQHITVEGTTGVDLIYGSVGPDVLAGDDGGDVIFGREGVDTIDAVDGVADDISGGPGEDIITYDDTLDNLLDDDGN